MFTIYECGYTYLNNYTKYDEKILKKLKKASYKS